MAIWGKINFFYDTMLGSAGSALTATSTAAGDYLVSYIYNMLETNMWKASSSANQTLSYDAGAGNTKGADYISILGHNLKTAGASIYLEWSDNNSNWTQAWSDTPTADTIYLKEFTQTAAHRYWRLRITGASVAVYMTLCIWGLKTELDYCTAEFDPYGQEVKANRNFSQGGYVTGIHTMYAERQIALTFEDADAALYGLIKTWWETSGLKNFFMAWEIDNNPNDVYLMRPDAKFFNPLTNGGLYRNVNINLTGRKE